LLVRQAADDQGRAVVPGLGKREAGDAGEDDERRGTPPHLFTEGRQMGTRQAPVRRCDRQLRDLTIPVRAAPSFIVSHDVALTDAPAAYDMFDGYTEALLKPNA